MSGATSDPYVQEAITRALSARMKFAKETFRKLGLSPREASHRALMINEIYIGLWHVDRVSSFAAKALAPNVTLKSHLRFIADLLLPLAE